MLPDEKMLKDENMEITTELLRISPLNVSEDLLAYLRSVLMMKNYEGEDKSLIMVSSPRIIDFELLVLDFAIYLLIEHARLPKNSFFMESSLREDTEKLSKLRQENQDPKAITILQYNI